MRMLRTALVASAYLLAAPASSATIIAGEAVPPSGASTGANTGAGPSADMTVATVAMAAGGSLAGLVLAGTLRRRRPTTVTA